MGGREIQLDELIELELLSELDDQLEWLDDESLDDESLDDELAELEDESLDDELEELEELEDHQLLDESDQLLKDITLPLKKEMESSPPT